MADGKSVCVAQQQMERYLASPRGAAVLFIRGRENKPRPRAVSHLTPGRSSSALRQRQDISAPGSASSYLTTPAEGEWDAGFDCSSLDPCSTPVLSANARSRCPITHIHTKDECRRKNREGSRFIPKRPFYRIRGVFFHTFC